MQLYFPNAKCKAGVISLFDFLVASKDSDENNIIFNSDLYLNDLSDLPGGNIPIQDSEIVDSDVLDFLGFVVQNFSNANAQLFQDLYVLWRLGNKQNGNFVEIGTGYPSGGNNTFILETKFNWRGICLEPNPCFHEAIKKTRKAILETCAVYSESGKQLLFHFPAEFAHGGSIEKNYEKKIGDAFETFDKITVNSITLVDCFEKHGFVNNIDYLSYDTTGNIDDIVILQKMISSGYTPKIITVGHNYKSHRNELKDMLEYNGYAREFEFLSKWDDWYYFQS